MPLSTLRNQVADLNYKHALILVHGLNGSPDSWKHDDDKFVAKFLNDALIHENFRIYIFEYHTKIFSYLDFWKRIKALIPGANKTAAFNIGLRKISSELEASVRAISDRYDTISFIGHSMGGVVVKKSLLFLSSQNIAIPRFFSLNVPHQGSMLANVGMKVLLGQNRQLRDLKLMGEYMAALNSDFSRADILTKIIYMHGAYDEVVPELSAIPPGVPPEDALTTSHDHFSILRISKEHINPHYDVIQKELQNVLHGRYNAKIGLTINVPGNAKFEDVAKMIVKPEKAQVDLTDVPKEHLACSVSSGFVTGKDEEEVLEKLRLSTSPLIPKYEVSYSENVYYIKMIRHE